MASHNENCSSDTTQSPILSSQNHEDNHQDQHSSSGYNQDMNETEVNSDQNLDQDVNNNHNHDLAHGEHHIRFSCNNMRRLRRTSGVNGKKSGHKNYQN
jgi:hypothetical protein